MNLNTRQWTLIALGLASLALIFLAVGISTMELKPGKPLPLGGMMMPQSSFAGDDLQPMEFTAFNIIISLLMWIMGPLFVLMFIISPRLRKSILRMLPIYVMMILFALWLQRQIQENRREQIVEEGLGQAEAMPPVPFPTPPDFVVDPPAWLAVVVTILVAIPTLLLLWFLWRRLNPPQEPTTLEILTDEAEEALATLRAGGDLKETILRCYADMSRILSRQRNINRQQAMTPREFEDHLAQAGFHSDHIQRLTRLFERVRYGAKSVGQCEELEAVDCLSAIVRTYGQSEGAEI